MKTYLIAFTGISITTLFVTTQVFQTPNYSPASSTIFAKNPTIIVPTRVPTIRVSVPALPTRRIPSPRSSNTPTPVRSSPTATQIPTKVSTKQELISTELLSAVNAYRTSKGLAPFAQNDRLCSLGRMRMTQLLQLSDMDQHRGFNEYFQKHKTTDLGFTTIAENLSKGYTNSTDIVSGWDASEPHRTGLLANPELQHACAVTGGDMSVLLAGK